MTYRTLTAASLLALTACNGYAATDEEAETATAAPAAEKPFDAEILGDFDEPWAMTFLPNGALLITEKQGTMRFVDFVEIGGQATQRLGSVSGMPEVDYGGQGGLGDVIAHPDFAENSMLYISYVEAGEGDTRGAAVMRGTLNCHSADECAFENAEVIWRQDKTTGRGHFGHRLAFGPDGHLWISSGERQKFEPAQDMSNNMGSIIRLNDDGSVPADNPFASRGGSTAQIWSYGHRNPLGIAFDREGNLWEHEMGPRHGDELNLIVRGENYGYPRVSNGDHYDGREIPDHSAGDGFRPPEEYWVPAISPAGFTIYYGDRFPAWNGTGLIGSLSGEAIVNVSLNAGGGSEELDRYDMGARIRELETGPDGYVYVLEDERNASTGRLLRLVPNG